MLLDKTIAMFLIIFCTLMVLLTVGIIQDINDGRVSTVVEQLVK